MPSVVAIFFASDSQLKLQVHIAGSIFTTSHHYTSTSQRLPLQSDTRPNHIESAPTPSDGDLALSSRRLARTPSLDAPQQTSIRRRSPLPRSRRQCHHPHSSR